MARIFLSHSSADNVAAIAVRDWLLSGGFDDVFLDLDPIGGIAAGERWERRLYEAANRCEAVVFLVSRSWMASEWCLREYDLAAKLNKRIFGVLIETIAIADLPARLRRQHAFRIVYQRKSNSFVLSENLGSGGRAASSRTAS